MCISSPQKPTQDYKLGYKLAIKIAPSKYQTAYMRQIYIIGKRMTVPPKKALSSEHKLNKEVNKFFRLSNEEQDQKIPSKVWKLINKTKTINHLEKYLSSLSSLMYQVYYLNRTVEKFVYKDLKNSSVYIEWVEANFNIIFAIEQDTKNEEGFHVYPTIEEAKQKLCGNEVILELELTDVLWESKQKDHLIVKTVKPIREVETT